MTGNRSLDLKIRDATIDDLPLIVEIYNSTIASRLSTADTEPVTVESRHEWFYSHLNGRNRPLWVAELEGTIAGWLSFNSFYGRPAYHRTAELSLYVAEPFRRRGVGRELLREAIARSPKLGIRNLLGFIFAHNEASLTLFERHGFDRWGYLPGVADLDAEMRDLLILGKKIGSAA